MFDNEMVAGNAVVLRTVKNAMRVAAYILAAGVA